MGYLSDRWGAEKRNAWLRAMARDGLSVEDATERVLGLSFAELDRQWRESLMGEEAVGAGAKGDDADKKEPGQ